MLMAHPNKNEYLNHDTTDQSDIEDGYDSEAAEIPKGGRRFSPPERSAKRRKVSSPEDDGEGRGSGLEKIRHDTVLASDGELNGQRAGNRLDTTTIKRTTVRLSHDDQTPKSNFSTTKNPEKKFKHKGSKPGVVYLSSVPPYLKPSALRNLLLQRGFSPITRLFLTPASKAKSGSKKNSRQLYTEGWIEFASKKTAKRCAEDLNAQIVGGKKGGFYHDDLWNMKYLRGMSWDELMAGIREEKREEEGRRDEERRLIAKETKIFVEGVEQGKRLEGIKRKRQQKGRDTNPDDRVDRKGDATRTWRQFEVKRKGTNGTNGQREPGFSEDVKEILGKIF